VKNRKIEVLLKPLNWSCLEVKAIVLLHYQLWFNIETRLNITSNLKIGVHIQVRSV